MAYEPTDRDRVWSILNGITEPLIISERVRPERREIFITHTKEFIDWDMSPDYYLEFSNDYTTIKKQKK